MLNEYTGYILGVLVTLFIVARYYIKHKGKKGMVGNCCALLIMMFFATRYVTFLIFPMPVQRSVIQSGFHIQDNFLLPFSNLVYLHAENVIYGNLTMTEFTTKYIASVFNFCIQIIPIGFWVQVVYKLNLKPFLVFSLCFTVGCEALKVLCNLITTINYISLITELLLYAFISLLLGFFLCHLCLWIAKHLSHKSDIMAVTYNFLKK